jgi:hypothetical protein
MSLGSVHLVNQDPLTTSGFGMDSSATIYQQFTLPADFTLTSFWVRMYAYGGGSGTGTFVAHIFADDGSVNDSLGTIPFTVGDLVYTWVEIPVTHGPLDHTLVWGIKLDNWNITSGNSVIIPHGSPGSEYTVTGDVTPVDIWKNGWGFVGPPASWEFSLVTPTAPPTSHAIHFTDTPELVVAGDSGTDDSTPAGGQSDAGITMSLSGTINPPAASTQYQDISSLEIRSLLTTELTVPEPAIIAGRPWVPRYWTRPVTSMTATVGTGHIHTVNDPDPFVTGVHPGGVTPDLWWTLKDLSGSARDLTSWPEHSGGPAWTSRGGYRPRYGPKTVHGPGGAKHTYPQALTFDPNHVEHMWIDLGSSMPQPYTVMIAGIINNYPNARYGHYFLDAGKPTPAKNTRYDWSIDSSDDMSYRSAMLFQLHSAIVCSRLVIEDGVIARCPHNYKPRPRVFIGQFAGHSSRVGYMDPKQKVLKSGRTDNNSVRHLVMGRRTNYVSNNLASSITVFEMRIFKSRLTENQLKAHYKQMAAAWHFATFTGRGS